MAERKAVNKYYPPEWTPQKGSINKFRGTHALRERARKLHMGILIIRFEMPFNIWCEGCGNHIGMGVRYNAEKTKVGMYYTTPIYKFRMKCHLCTNHFEIQTDPQNLDYTILNGAKRQERRWDPSENDQVAPEDKEIGKKMALDAMYRLEHGAEDKAKQKAIAPTLARLEVLQDRWKDDYELNKILRKQFREKKKCIKVSEEKDKALLAKSSLNITLVPESKDDIKLARLLKLNPVQSYKERRKAKRKEIITKPLLGGTKPLKDDKKSADWLNGSSFTLEKSSSSGNSTKQDLTSRLGISRKAEKSSTSVRDSGTEPVDSSMISENSKKTSLVSFDYDSTTSEENCD